MTVPDPSTTTTAVAADAPVKLSYDITQHSLLANDGPLEPRDMAPLRPSTLDTPLEELQRRYNEDGYLFMKGVLPVADVKACRSAYFEFMRPTGVLAPGTDAVAGIFDAAKPASAFPGIGVTTDAGGYGDISDSAQLFLTKALKAHTEPFYESLCAHPALRDFVARLTGWGADTVTLRRTLLRNNLPGTKAIGVHYDQIFLRHGEPTAVTAWVPIGDIEVRGGGLIYLEGSHKLGAEIEAAFFEKAAAAGMTNEETRYAFNNNMMKSGLLADGPVEFGRERGKRWLVADYEAGDVVFHQPFMIHASALNESPTNAIRLATDLRFANGAREWDTRWMKDYEPEDGL
ncbi:phytanoyl-CoA hydroxylase [Geopyxis carbonaria]|nr:phytanoyl-CoA hydroxylase [Geopyxis carbonaria]